MCGGAWLSLIEIETHGGGGVKVVVVAAIAGVGRGDCSDYLGVMW